MTSFNEFGLAEPILRALAQEKYVTPTPIQAQTIPLACQNRDVIGIAQTGTGKTAAFGLPMIERMLVQNAAARHTPRGLILVPTRELAAQWGGRGVRVNALAPCFFPGATTGWLQDPDQVAWISAHTPLGRPPRPEELDGPLLFLAGDASSYVTGQTLYVDGG